MEDKTATGRRWFVVDGETGAVELLDNETPDAELGSYEVWTEYCLEDGTLVYEDFEGMVLSHDEFWAE